MISVAYSDICCCLLGSISDSTVRLLLIASSFFAPTLDLPASLLLFYTFDFFCLDISHSDVDSPSSARLHHFLWWCFIALRCWFMLDKRFVSLSGRLSTQFLLISLCGYALYSLCFVTVLYSLIFQLNRRLFTSFSVSLSVTFISYFVSSTAICGCVGHSLLLVFLIIYACLCTSWGNCVRLWCCLRSSKSSTGSALVCSRLVS